MTFSKGFSEFLVNFDGFARKVSFMRRLNNQVFAAKRNEHRFSASQAAIDAFLQDKKEAS